MRGISQTHWNSNLFKESICSPNLNAFASARSSTIRTKQISSLPTGMCLYHCLSLQPGHQVINIVERSRNGSISLCFWDNMVDQTHTIFICVCLKNMPLCPVFDLQGLENRDKIFQLHAETSRTRTRAKRLHASRNKR